MSSTNRGGERIALDAYFTPDAVARACVATIGDEIYGWATPDPNIGSWHGGRI